MKRRQAIQQLAVLSIGPTVFPSCQFESLPVYEHLPLERAQYKLLEKLTTVLLPTEPDLHSSVTNFVLTFINDCFAPKDIIKYLNGLQDFSTKVQTKHQNSFEQLNPAEQLALMEQFDSSNIALRKKAVEEKKVLKDLETAELFFFRTTKQLVQKHFISTESFQKEVLNFEFIPARYNGCAPV